MQHPDIHSNSVEIFFSSIAGYFGINEAHGWKQRLWDEIGPAAGIKSASEMRTWISRGSIPQTRLKKILAMDLPDKLKTLAEACRKPRAHRSAEHFKRFDIGGGWTPQTKQKDWGELGKVYEIFRGDKESADRLSTLINALHKEMVHKRSEPPETTDPPAGRSAPIEKTIPTETKISDVEVLARVISRVKKHIQKRPGAIPPEKEARIVALLYNYFVKTGDGVNQETVMSYLRLLE